MLLSDSWIGAERPYRRGWTPHVRRVLALAAAALLIASCGGNGGGPQAGTDPGGTGGDGEDGQDLEPLNITISATSSYLTAGFLPRFGVEQGIFEEHGLDVEFVSGNSSVEIGTAVVSSSADTGAVTPAVGWPMIEEGGDLMYAVNEYPISTQVIARSDVEMPNIDEPFPAPLGDLEGKTVGVPAVGASQQTIVLAMAEQVGLSEGDMTFVGIGADGVTAFQAAEIDVLVTNIPDEIRIGEDDYQVVVDQETVAAEFGPVLSSAYTARTDADPELVARFCRAMTATLEYAMDAANEEVVAEALGGALNLTDEQARETWETFGPGFTVGLVTADVWTTTAESTVYGGLTVPDFAAHVYQGDC